MAKMPEMPEMTNMTEISEMTEMTEITEITEMTGKNKMTQISTKFNICRVQYLLSSIHSEFSTCRVQYLQSSLSVELIFSRVKYLQSSTYEEISICRVQYIHNWIFAELNIDLLSPNWPGIFSRCSNLTLNILMYRTETKHQLSYTWGAKIILHDKTPDGFCEKVSWKVRVHWQPAGYIPERWRSSAAPAWGPPGLICSTYSLSCCSAKFLNLSTMLAALLQSYT